MRYGRASGVSAESADAQAEGELECPAVEEAELEGLRWRAVWAMTPNPMLGNSANHAKAVVEAPQAIAEGRVAGAGR